MKVGLVYDPIYLKHDTGQHVENAGRLEDIMAHLKRSGIIEKLVQIKPRPATIEEVGLVHPQQHISHIQEVSHKGGGWLDADTVVSADSYEVALYAAGGTITATDAVIKGKVSSAFALVRPPGHHAIPEQAMGFCLFNNAAIAAKYARSAHKLERILIIDFDVHHGNGTQAVFYDSPDVLYASTHEYPFYPGTGSIAETGRNAGQGTTVNIPLPAGCGDTEYLLVFEQVIAPVARRFKPQLILVSAGYDLHWADPIALMQATVTGIAGIVEVIKSLANELCDGRLVFTLEGGYNNAALSTSINATLDVLLGNTSIDDPLEKSPRQFTAPGIDPLIREIKGKHNLS
jgi:acetoin utilization deacetylase AcuC-like enzyme